MCAEWVLWLALHMNFFIARIFRFWYSFGCVLIFFVPLGLLSFRFFLSSLAHTHSSCRRHFNWLDEFIITVILQKKFALLLLYFLVCYFSLASVHMIIQWWTLVLRTTVGVSYTFILIISMTIYRHVCFFFCSVLLWAVCSLLFYSRFQPSRFIVHE